MGTVELNFILYFIAQQSGTDQDLMSALDGIT